MARTVSFEIGSGAWTMDAVMTAKVRGLRGVMDALKSVRQWTVEPVADAVSFYDGIAEYVAAAKLVFQYEYARLLLDAFTPNWQTDRPDLHGLVSDERDRTSPEYRVWRLTVLKRDGMACRSCGSKEALHAHHIEPWALAPHYRFDVANGVVLCQPCHAEQHRNMGRQLW